MTFPKNLNHTVIGFSAGILAPPVVMLATYYNKAHVNTLVEFVQFLLTFQALSNLISLCVVPNLLLFFVCIWTERMASARGVLMSTMFYAFLVFIVKFTS